MSEFRNILADGDLIRQRKRPCWWLFGDEKWQPYRNISREVRSLEEMMHAAHAAYKQSQEYYVVASANMKADMELLRKYKGLNSEAVYELPGDESILYRRDGVKYSGNGNQNQKQKGQNNGGQGNNQQNNQSGGENGDGNNQNHNQNQNGKQQNKGRQPHKKSLLALLASAEITMH